MNDANCGSGDWPNCAANDEDREMGGAIGLIRRITGFFIRSTGGAVVLADKENQHGKSHKRAFWRHHLARSKKNRADYCGGYARDLTQAEQLRHIGRFARAMPSCRCWMCGNPRGFFGEITMQEKRFAEEMRWGRSDETDKAADIGHETRGLSYRR